MEDALGHYQAVLRDLERRRSRCRRELANIQQTIARIRNLMNGSVGLFESTPIVIAQAVDDAGTCAVKKYAGMSVRSAVLKLLLEDASGPLKTSEIATLLAAGGIFCTGQDFTGNVSAVVSNMVNKRKELEPAEKNRYMVTDSGRSAWDAMKSSPKYLNRAFPANVQ